MNPKILIMLVILGMGLILWYGTGRAHWRPRPAWMPELLYRLAVCETGLNWRHNSGSYHGAFGWYWGTWLLDRYPGYPYRAYNATPWQQVQVARRSIWRGRYFGCLENSSWVRAAR